MPDGTVTVSFEVKNVGGSDGDEVAQVYYHRADQPAEAARESLCGFARVHVAKGQAATVSLDIPATRFRHWDEKKKAYVVDPGTYDLMIGGASDDVRTRVPVEVRLGT